MDLSDFAGDTNLEENGAWIALEDAEFLIAAHMNRRHRKAIAKLQQKYAKAIRTNDEKGKEKMSIEGLAEAVLLDWRGNVMLAGQPLGVYSRDAAVKILGIKAFREWVLEQAATVSNFAAEKEVADVAETKSGARVEPDLGEASGVPRGASEEVS